VDAGSVSVTRFVLFCVIVSAGSVFVTETVLLQVIVIGTGVRSSVVIAVVVLGRVVTVVSVCS
jgi:hypothetical protein